MSTMTTPDGTEIYSNDWGTGPVVTFSHGWPLNAEAWDEQRVVLAQPAPFVRPGWTLLRLAQEAMS